MSVQLYVAPAACGKTAFVLERARQAAAGLSSTPRVVVASMLQRQACRRRLAEAGGALGVRVLTFDQLCTECLSAAGEVYVRLSEPVQYRLIRAVVDSLELSHYQPLVRRPGFVQVLQDLIAELKAARVWPEAFRHAVRQAGDEPRLSELAQVYEAYQERLQSEGWADWAGTLWLAVEALEQRAPQVGRHWPLLLIDGFDDFTEVQLALLSVLAKRVGELCITMTGCAIGPGRGLAHRRFRSTLQRLQETLGLGPARLPDAQSHLSPALAHLEAQLFQDHPKQREADGSLDLLEATDRASEVRGALRWLKARLVRDGLRPKDVALLARNIAPYRPYILQTAAEFGLPIRLVGGLPLESNPAITALLDLLRLMLPLGDDDPQPALKRRNVIEAWRSPYFDWSTLADPEDPQSASITAQDVDALDRVARWGQVVAGRAQWEEALELLVARHAESQPEDEERGAAEGRPSAAGATALRTKFRTFVQRIAPLEGQRTMREHVAWLEGLIGDDPDLQHREPFPRAPEASSLQIVEQARRDAASGEPLETAERDVAALQALKDLLRGLVWAEEAAGTGAPMDFPRFMEELDGAVRATSYQTPMDPLREELLASSVQDARGLGFAAAAVIGLAEGEFPATLSEDPFVTDADRARLSKHLEHALKPSLESYEAELFYEGITRSRDGLLLTRPRLADNGAEWQSSPFWEEVLSCLAVEPRRLVASEVRSPAEVASWPEWMTYLAACDGDEQLLAWTRQQDAGRVEAWERAMNVLHSREFGGGPFHGDLAELAREFAAQYGPQHTWSASRLESYLTCPFSFFITSVLKLEPRVEPQEGLDARQLGNLYHRLFEQVYKSLPADPPPSLEQLLEALPTVAAAILEQAPSEEGFRATAWWAQTSQEIVENVSRSLEGLHAPDLQADYQPTAHECRFFDDHRLVVGEGDDQFCLHGVIDRLEQAPDGRVRIIDYKTAGPGRYGNTALTDGDKIQLPLYALAARDALGLGEPADGFYWHVGQAQRSAFTLRGYAAKCGRDPIDVALEFARQAVRGVREAAFAPQQPHGGCPGYCAAAGFCPLYSPGFGG